MKLVSLATDFPSQSFTQIECLEEMRKAPFWRNLKDRSKLILEKVLESDSSIKKGTFKLMTLLRYGEEAQRNSINIMNYQLHQLELMP